MRLRLLVALLVLIVAVALGAVTVFGDLGVDGRRSQAASPPGPAVAGLEGPAPTVFAGAEGRVRLGGSWTYRADPGDVGLAQGWEEAAPDGTRVSIPHSPNAWPVGAAAATSFEGSVGWYTKRFRVRRSGRYVIRFESVHHTASVWIDGRPVGEHVGAYMPFEARPLLEGGRRHTLTVRVDWRSPLGMKKAGWHRGWFNFGGINREVTLRRLSASELEAPNIQTELASEGGAKVTLAVRVHNRRRTRRIGVVGTLTHGDQTVRFRFPPKRIRRGGERVIRGRFTIEDPALWSPARPDLYDLRLWVPREGGYRARVGLRELDWRDRRLWLNGRPLFLRGASIQEDARRRGDAMTAEDQSAMVERLKALGANATRAQHPLSPALLERLDAAGILVWQQVGAWDSPGNWLETTPELRQMALERVRASAEQLQTHPSILAWNLANEMRENGHPGQDVYIDAAARTLHERDPGRPVAVDLWGILLPRSAGPVFRNVDLIGATNYFGWYEDPFAGPRRIAHRVRRRVAHLRRLFPDKVIVATEFGAEGNSSNRPSAHGGLAYQANLLAVQLRTYRRIRDVAGMLIWGLSDFAINPAFNGGSIHRKVSGVNLPYGLNQKGLFDYRGRAKPAAAVVRREFLRARRERG